MSAIKELLPYRRPFVLTLLVALLVLAVSLFMVRREYSVRSTIAVPATFADNKLTPLYQPDQMAKQVTSGYLFPALLELSQKGVLPLTLNTLERTKAEAAGLFVNLSSSVQESQQDDARRFQQLIVDQIIKERAVEVEALRKSVAAKVASANRASRDLVQQTRDFESQIQTLSASAEELKKQIGSRQSEPTTAFKNTANSNSADERAVNETVVRELREQIGSLLVLTRDTDTQRLGMARALVDIKRQNEEQLKAAADGERELETISDTRVLLPPSVIPVSIGPRRLSLLLAGFFLSLMAAFGTVVVLYNFDRHFGSKKPSTGRPE